MSEDFIKLVARMRTAQRRVEMAYSQREKVAASKLEYEVDKFLQMYTAEKAQLDLWTRQMRTDESAGVYDTDVNVEKKESANK